MSVLEAIRARDSQRLPSRRDESWRWTDLRAAVRAVPEASPPQAAPVRRGPFASVQGAQEILVLNGRRQDGEGVIRVEGEALIALRFVSGAAGGSHTASVEFDVRQGASLTLLESYEGQAAGYVAAYELSFRLSDGASVERVVIQTDAPDAVGVSTAQVLPAPGAAFAQTVLTTGARLQRHETHVVHPGGGAQVRLDAIYCLTDEARTDLTSIVEHEGLNGVTTEMAKGVVTDTARAVFQGRIVVARGADGTDARLRHDALILSDRAEVDAKPELEIYADDVQCAHGNTIGALDDEQLFYIRSRGIPARQAKALLTQAFLGEVVERIAHEGARQAATGWLAAQMQAISL